MDVSLIEIAVYRYPRGMNGWRAYRVEYGGHAEDCLLETTLWLPENVDAREIEEILSQKDNSTGE